MPTLQDLHSYSTYPLLSWSKLLLAFHWSGCMLMTFSQSFFVGLATSWNWRNIQFIVTNITEFLLTSNQLLWISVIPNGLNNWHCSFSVMWSVHSTGRECGLRTYKGVLCTKLNLRFTYVELLVNIEWVVDHTYLALYIERKGLYILYSVIK